MTDMKKDLAEIEAFLNSPSPLGNFKRKDMPEYDVLRAELENAGRILSKAEYVFNMRRVQYWLAEYRLKCFVSGETVSKKKVDEIEEKIKVFITELQNGLWS